MPSVIRAVGEHLFSKSSAMAGTNPVAGKVCVVTGGAGSDFLWEWSHRVELAETLWLLAKFHVLKH